MQLLRRLSCLFPLAASRPVSLSQLSGAVYRAVARFSADPQPSHKPERLVRLVLRVSVTSSACAAVVTTLPPGGPVCLSVHAADASAALGTRGDNSDLVPSQSPSPLIRRPAHSLSARSGTAKHAVQPR